MQSHTHTTSPHAPWKDASSRASMLAMFNALYSSSKLFEKNLCNQSSHYESYGQFLLRIEAIMRVLQNQPFLWWAKINRTQRKALVSPWRVHFMTAMPQNTPLRLKQCRVVKKSSSYPLPLSSYTGLKESGRQAGWQ